MKEIRVLVLGAGGNVSQGIIKALRNSDLNIRIIGACISAESAGLYMCDEAYISPYACDDKFIVWLIDICNSLNIDMILSGVEEIIIAIEEKIKLLEVKTRARFVASPIEKLKIGKDKFLTCEWLKAQGCNYPRFCLLNDVSGIERLVEEVGYPLIVKPRSGKGSKGVLKIQNGRELAMLEKSEEYILQEYIGTEESEYTVGCYVDKKRLSTNVIIMHRKLKNGTTIYATVEENSKIYDEARKICDRFAPHGPLNIQLRTDKSGRPVCFEMNVRFSGTTAMRSKFGFCDVEAMIREYLLEESIDNCFNVKCGEAYRYDTEMYIFGNATDELKSHYKISDMSKFEIRE